MDRYINVMLAGVIVFALVILAATHYIANGLVGKGWWSC